MQDGTKPNDGGLGAPAKRGRPRKLESDSGTSNGSEKLTGGNAEPLERTENASARASEPTERIPSGFLPIDPLTVDGNSSGGDRPRRGRKPGGKNRPKEETVPNLTSLKIEDLLTTACFFLGNWASCPEVYASPEEAEKVGEAYREFAKFHAVGISEKRMSEINLVIAVGAFGIPRGKALWKANPPKPKPKLVAPMPIRETPEASPMPAPMEDGPFGPVNGLAVAPEEAKTPSQMWPQGGDIQDNE